MKNTVHWRACLWLTFVFFPLAASAQDQKEAPAQAAPKAVITRAVPETVVQREVFTGNEARIAAPNWVNTDCSSGAVPDLRIATPPANGELRQEEITMPIDRPKDNNRAICNGKPVKAMGVFYKSKAGYTGADNVVIDIDFKTGVVRRFNYKITVR
jgi:hypothetical protein